MRPWRTLARRTLLSRLPWMEVGDERVALPDGRVIDDFLWIRTSDFAATVAVTASDDVLLLRAYKHGPRSVALAVPAGYVAEGEDPLETAKRELREETGHEAERWTSLGVFVVDGNYGVGRGHLFLATGARRVTEPRSGDLEEMEIVTIPFAQVRAILRASEVVQLSSAAALALAALYRETR